MWTLAAVALAAAGAVRGVRGEERGGYHHATQGEVWPRPREERKQYTYYTFNPDMFHIEMVGVQCALLVGAVARCRDVVLSSRRRDGRVLVTAHARDDQHGGLFTRLLVNLTQPCEMYPHHDMDESYYLNVTSPAAVLRADSVWGALRGLETFSQLFYYTRDYREVLINATSIHDWPRYRHRGLLVDSARHYLPPATLLLILDAMAMNKMNVLHWHLTDDQSFPYESSAYPLLSEKGAFHPSLVYKASDVEEVVQFARDRGIRVIPEFDMPGHTRSWGHAYPELLTQCTQPPRRGPLDPSNEDVYEVLRRLFLEVSQQFPDRYLHLGGDEVDDTCWASNAEVVALMSKTFLSRPRQLHGMFLDRVRAVLGRDVRLIVWEEVFHNVRPLDKNVTVQVWKSAHSGKIEPILRAGHSVIMSTGWYLDHLDQSLAMMYQHDPRRAATRDPVLWHRVVGGEACMWGEMVDETNIMTRVWPRASAVAEVLWSSEQTWDRGGPVARSVQGRLEEQVCRMLRRGLDVAPPLGPDFCLRRP